MSRSCLHPKLKDLLIALGEQGIKHFQLDFDGPTLCMNEIKGHTFEELNLTLL